MSDSSFRSGSQLLPQLRKAIVRYLREESKQATWSDDQRESLEVAQQFLSTAFQVDVTDEAPSLETDLPRVYEQGLSVLKQNSAPSVSVVQSTSNSANSSASIDAPEEPQLQRFLQLLKQKGFFSGVEPNTPAYAERYEKALKAFQKHREDTANALKEEGNKLLLSKRYRESIEKYSEAIDMNPSVAIFYCNRAASYSHLGEYEKAVIDCKEAIKLDPTYRKAYSRLGNAYESLGNLEDAINMGYKKAVELEPGSQDAQQALAAAEAALRRKQAGLGGGSPDFSKIFQSLQSSEAFSNLSQSPELQQLAENFSSKIAVSEDGSSSSNEDTKTNVPAFDPTSFQNAANMLNDPSFSQMMGNPQLQQVMNDPNMIQMASNFVQQNPDILNQMFSMFGGSNASGS